jgi:tyrosyl-tRNA synthetase
LDRPEIEALEQQHSLEPGSRHIQKKLAEEVTRLVHGETGLAFAKNATALLFGNADKDTLLNMSETELKQAMEGVPLHKWSLTELENGTDVVSLLAGSGVFSSKGEARKMIQGGGVLINRQKVESVEQKIDKDSLLHGKYLLAQKGKKNFFLIELEP